MISAMASSKQAGTRSERRELVWLSVAGIVLALVGVSVPLLAGGVSSTSLGQPSPGRENLSFTVVMIAFALFVVGVVQMVRAQMFTAARWERAGTLSIGQRRQMGRWIRRGEAAPSEMTQATTVTAERLVHQRKSTLFFVGFVLMMVGTALGATSLWRLTFTVVGAVVMVAIVVLIRRDANLAQRWLEVHQQPVTSEVTGS